MPKINWEIGLIEFKCDEPNFSKELKGFKCNTIRVVETDDIADEVLSSLYHLNCIRVVSTKDGKSFERTLTDITVYRGRIVFSWTHPAGLGEAVYS